MPPVVAQLDFLRQDDVDRMLLAVGRSQEEIPLLPHQLAVLCVRHPRLTAVKKDDARRDQDHQTGEETQNGEADDLAAGDQRTGRLERLSLGRTQQLVESVGRYGVVTRTCRFHAGFGLELADMEFAGRAGESGRTGAADPAVRVVEAGASVHARIGLADVRLDLTEGAGESRWTEAGTAVRATRVHAGSSVLAARAADESKRIRVSPTNTF